MHMTIIFSRILKFIYPGRVDKSAILMVLASRRFKTNLGRVIVSLQKEFYGTFLCLKVLASIYPYHLYLNI